MATARYDIKKNGWILHWKSYVLELEGQYPYKTKFKTDRTYPTLTPTQKKRVEASVQAEADKLEMEGRNGAVKNNELNKPLNAIDYLSSLTRLTRSNKADSEAYAKASMDKLVAFLKKRYSGLYLHQINSVVAEEFIRSQKGYAYTSVETMRHHLAYIFGRICNQMEDSDLKYKNPWRTLIVKDIVTLKPKTQKAFISPQQFKTVLKNLHLPNARVKRTNDCLEAMFHMLWCYGWRICDVAGLKWSNVDFENRVITVTHSKTKDSSGAKTAVYLTDKMKSLLKRCKCREDYVFDTCQKLGAKMNPTSNNEDNLRRYLREQFDKMGLDEANDVGKRKVRPYTVHSIRGSVATLLKLNDFGEERVAYLLGHAGKSIEEKAYNRFYLLPKESTQAMVECMEGLIA